MEFSQASGANEWPTWEPTKVDWLQSWAFSNHSILQIYIKSFFPFIFIFLVISIVVFN